MKMNYIEFPRKQSRRKNYLDNLVFTTRLRISRNIDGINFPLFLEKENKIKLEDEICKEILNVCPDVLINKIEDFSYSDLLIYLSNGVLTSEFIRNSRVFGYPVSGDWVFFLNEDDHLKVFSIEYGYNAREIYKKISNFIDKLEAKMDFAYDEVFGYLTSSILNVGTGLRISFIVNLPGLFQSETIDSLTKSLKEISYSIKPFYEPKIPLYYIFNLFSMGISEEEILCEFESLLTKIAHLEFEAREKYIFGNKVKLAQHLKKLFELKDKNELTYLELLEYVSLVDLFNKKVFDVDDINTIRGAIFTGVDEYLTYKYNLTKEELNRARLYIIKRALSRIKYKKAFI
jgi:protein arginine kinase